MQQLENVESNIINPYNIDNRVFKGISSTAKLMIPKGTRSKYEVLSGWTNNFKEISEIGATTLIHCQSQHQAVVLHRMVVQRFGVQRSRLPSMKVLRLQSRFTPDAGYRIKSLKVNGSAKTASSSYDVTVNAYTSVEVEFEAIPPTTYTLSIKATGSGSASYSGTTVRGTTKSFTVNEGTKATITFTPDAGYRIKSLKVNGSAKTASTSYKVTVNADTSVEVEFEAIPSTTYTLSIKATGSGSASYSGTTIKGTTKSFTLNEGTKATITFTPDAGYQIAKVKVNSSDVTSKLSKNQYTVTVNSNTSVEVEFGKVADSEHSIDGHEYVDLGLPSGGYWSVVNYGAENQRRLVLFRMELT